MKHYTIIVSGHEAIQARWTLAEAKKELRDMMVEQKKACIRRFKRAHVHSQKYSWSITLGPDPRSALWLSAAIVDL
tara:strand:- start:696 stop:923 length:228 start_codon:yes stop_codon:yes gene_type:complete